ncbi:Cytochrome P450 87A3, partial [Bienertia sinuspersici]
LVGRPIIVSADPELSYLIFQQEGQTFQSWYPDTFTEIFGRENVGSLHGFMYKYLKNMVLSLFGPESLKKMLPEVEATILKKLNQWSTMDTVEIKDSTASGRKKAMKMLKSMLHERRMMPRKENTDFFDYVLVELEKEGTLLTEGIALDLMFSKLQVINETVRLANIVPGIFRKAMRDVSFKGYTIPAGWGVMVCPPAVHLNPARYENPLDFNPWRWEGGEINGASKHFMAFGGGMRFCVGTDFTKIQMAVFLHCLVTKYR